MTLSRRITIPTWSRRYPPSCSIGVLGAILLAQAGFAQAGPSVTASSPVAAQPAATEGLEVITVTAQRRSENLQRVPVAVTAVSDQALKAAGVIDSSQLPNVVSGLAIQIGGAEFEPHLRGIGTTSDGPGLENPVALYVDGVYYGPQSSIPRNLFNVDQVSVLKGPQGTLFGRNATGGVIQFTTRNPTEKTQAEFQTSLDNYLTTLNDAYVSGSLADHLTANFWGHYGYQGKGWGANLATGNDIHRINKDIALRSKVRWAPANDTDILLNFDYADRKDSNGLCLVPYPGTTPALPGFRKTTNKWDTDDAVDCTESVKSGGASATITQGLGFAKLVSITAYRQVSYDQTFSTGLSPIRASVLRFPDVGKQFTQELQLISPSGGKFSWTLGAYYFHSNNASDRGGDGEQIFLSGPFAPTPNSLGQIQYHTRIVDDSVAGFGQATYEILPDTRLTGGFRYNYEHKRFAGSEFLYLADGTPLGQQALPPFASTITEKRPIWRVAVDHKFAPDILGYVSYNRGFKSGGYNGNDPTNPPYGPEKLDAYEVGLKSEMFERHLRLNLAGFYYKYSNIQVSRYTSTAVIYNGAGADLYGLDVDAVARLTGNLTLNAGLEWLHTKFTSFKNAEFSQPLPGGGAALFSGDATGNPLPFAPKLTLDASINYSHDMTFGRMDYNITNNYNSGYYTEASLFFHQRAYDKLAATVKWTSRSGNYSLKLWANNLLDKAVYSFTAIQATGYDVAYGNPPRTFGFTLDARY